MKTNHIFNVRDYGAIGDGKTFDTHAIQNTINNCNEAGGGVVFFPAGYKFLTGTIFLKDNIHIHLDGNSVILGSTDIDDYSRDTGICPYYPEPLDYCLIYGLKRENITFSGSGVIDGQFRDELFIKDDNPLEQERIQRPMLIRLEECRNITMRDLTLKGAYSWCVHIKYCSNVKLTAMTVLNDRQDGFNIESSETITISDCTLNCGDDGIALTTSHRNKPLKDLTVTNCIISSRWAAVRMGPLSKGNFENITMSNCVLRDCGGGGIKLGMFEGAEIKNCIFNGIVMDNVTAPIFVMNAQWTDIGSTDNVPRMMPPGNISGLMFSNMIIKANAGPTLPWDRNEYTEEEIEDFLIRPDRNSTIFLHGHRDGLMEDITFQNINISLPGGGVESTRTVDDLIDMHEIEIDKHGYWTDDKTIWGIPLSSAFFIRHGKHIDLDKIKITYRATEERPSVACIDSEHCNIDRVLINGVQLNKDKILH